MINYSDKRHVCTPQTAKHVIVTEFLIHIGFKCLKLYQSLNSKRTCHNPGRLMLCRRTNTCIYLRVAVRHDTASKQRTVIMQGPQMYKCWSVAMWNLNSLQAINCHSRLVMGLRVESNLQIWVSSSCCRFVAHFPSSDAKWKLNSSRNKFPPFVSHLSSY